MHILFYFNLSSTLTRDIYFESNDRMLVVLFWNAWSFNIPDTCCQLETPQRDSFRVPLDSARIERNWESESVSEWVCVGADISCGGEHIPIRDRGFILLQLFPWLDFLSNVSAGMFEKVATDLGRSTPMSLHWVWETFSTCKPHLGKECSPSLTGHPQRPISSWNSLTLRIASSRCFVRS